MSMNILIYGERRVSFKDKQGKRKTSTQTIKFNAMQTPTKVTYNIMEQADKAAAYIEYIKRLSNPEQLAVYAEDDVFGEGQPVKYIHYDWTEEHINTFIEWIHTVEEDGYTVKFEVI